MIRPDTPTSHRPRARALSCALACLAPVLAMAQPAPSTSGAVTTPPAATLGEVRIVARPEDPQSTPGSAYVLTERELAKFQATNVHSILRSVPGVYLREEDGLGTFPRIGIRASSSGRSDRVSIMEDGVPAAMAPYANPSAYYFPTVGRMSSIEVLKGPEVLLYGPQTTSGAINLLSTPIPDRPSGQLNVELGTQDTRKLHGWAGGTYGQWGVLVETWQRDTDGFQRIDRSNRTAGSDAAEYLVKLRWRSAPEARYAQQVDLKLFDGDEKADVSYLGLTDTDFRRDPDRRYGLSELERMNRGRKSASLRHQIALDADTLMTTTAYWSDTYRHYTRLGQINGVGIGGSGVTWAVNNGLSNGALLQGILDGTADTTHANGVRYNHNNQDFTSTGLQAELLRGFTTGKVRHELIAGVRAHRDEARSASPFTYYQQVNGGLVFDRFADATATQGEAKAVSFWIGDRIDLGRLKLLPLVRHERIETHANVAQPRTDTNSNRLNETTFGLGANYALTDRWTLLAGVHQGFAPPGSSAARGTRGEESLNFEAGVRWRGERGGFDAIAFHSDYSNALRNCLVANPCPGGVTEGTEQTGSKDVYGLEFGAFAELGRMGGMRFPARLAYTYTDGKYTRDSDVANGVLKGDALDYTPKHVASLQVGAESAAGWNAYASFNYSDGSCVTTTCDRNGLDTRFLRTQSLFTVDLAASLRVSPTLDLYARVENLFDERRITHRGADGARGNPARYVGVGLRARF